MNDFETIIDFGSKNLRLGVFNKIQKIFILQKKNN